MIASTKIEIKLTLVLVVILAIALFFLSGCQSAPDRKCFNTEECYSFADCLYRNQKSDKSVCAVLGEACRDSLKEKRIYDRVKYCGEFKPKDMTENECRLFLNQK